MWPRFITTVTGLTGRGVEATLDADENLPREGASVRVCVPDEVQDNENRVGMTPTGVRKLTEAGHDVVIQASAGEGAGFDDAAYREAGAEITPNAETVWGTADLVVKVKQPTEEESALFRQGSAFFGYTHTETRPWLARAFLERGMSAISFERVRLEDGSLPLLAPMSRIAGHMSILIGAQLLQTVHGGPGVLVGEMPGTGQARVVILGGGTVGEYAARAALALGAGVTVFELSERRRAHLAETLPGVKSLSPEAEAIAAAVVKASLVVNATPIISDAEQHLVTREMVRTMPDGAVVIDVTAEPRGAIETSLRLTSHSEPTFVEEGVTHYVVPNIPGVVPRSSTLSLEEATLPYTLMIADLGVQGALEKSSALVAGLLCLAGKPIAEDMRETAG